MKKESKESKVGTPLAPGFTNVTIMVRSGNLARAARSERRRRAAADRRLSAARRSGVTHSPSVVETNS